MLRKEPPPDPELDPPPEDDGAPAGDGPVADESGTSVSCVADWDVRLLRFCKQQFRGFLPSKKECETAIRRGDVAVNGVAQTNSACLLHAGDAVELRHPPAGSTPPTSGGVGQPPVLYEDDDMAAVWKGSGVVLAGRERHTLQHALPACLAASRVQHALTQPAIINALSRSVSGVVLVAKSQAALQGLTAACRAGQIRCQYRVMVEGRPTPSCRPGVGVELREDMCLVTGAEIHPAEVTPADGGPDLPIRGVVVAVTPSLAARYLTTLDLTCTEPTQALVRHRLHACGLRVVGAGQTSNQTAKSYQSCRGLFISLVAVRLVHPVCGTELCITADEPEKFGRLRQRELAAFLRKHPTAAALRSAETSAGTESSQAVVPRRFMEFALDPTPDMQTTADAPNRIHDQQELEAQWGLPEFGSAVEPMFAARDGAVLAVGYERIVYGDHGPYVEFQRHHLQLDNWVMNESKRHPDRFYDEWYSKDGTCLLYDQLRPVADQPDPPPGPRSVCNGRPDGYADYRVGRFYLALTDDLLVGLREEGPPEPG